MIRPVFPLINTYFCEKKSINVLINMHNAYLLNLLIQAYNTFKMYIYELNIRLD